MNSSFRLGSLLGITIRVHVLLLPFIGVILLSIPDTLVAACFIATLAGVVLLHELGHSIVAQSFGIRVVDITLWPLGGMARMSDIPESSKIEGLIALAGPIVNFVLAALAGSWLWFNPNAGGALVGEAISTFLVLNLAMGTFNLIPAFPMDGGRVLRAILARKGDWVRATETAVTVGRVFAVLMGLAGVTGFLLPQRNFVLPLIAMWLWWIGSQELDIVRRRHAPSPFQLLAELARRAAQQQAAAATQQSTRATDHSAQMQAAPVTEAGARRLTDEEIARLEQYRGRLRHYRADRV